jgi:hypothetical protein
VTRRDFDAEFRAAVARVAAARYGGDEEAALEEVYEDDELADESYAWALLGCLRAAPELLDHVRQCLADPDPRVHEYTRPPRRPTGVRQRWPEARCTWPLRPC